MKRGGILFLSPHNAVRSQIAEAWARSIAGSSVDVYSAGSDPTSLDWAVRHVMQEVGIDVRGQRAKSIDAIPLAKISSVVTLCPQTVWPDRPPRLAHYYCSFEDVIRTSDSLDERMRSLHVLRDQIGRILTDYFRRSQQTSLLQIA